MSLWEQIREFYQRNARKYVSFYIPKERVEPYEDDRPVGVGEAYCQLWLTEMYLAHDREKTVTRYPVVHTAIRYDYNGAIVTVPCITEPTMIQEITKKNLNRISQHNTKLTPLFPFNKGPVELQAGLFGVATNKPVETFIKSMSKLSKVLTIPEFSRVADLANPIYNSIEDLLGIENQELQLAYYDTLTEMSGKSNMLRPGYFVIILAEDRDIEKDKLCIVNGTLSTGSPGQRREFLSDHRPFEGYNYMLFCLRIHKAQNWNQITLINNLVKKAQTSLYQGRKKEVEEYLLPNIKCSIIESPDIIDKDREPMIRRIVAKLNKIGLHTSEQEVPVESLYAIMQQPLPSADPELESQLAILRQLFVR